MISVADAQQKIIETVPVRQPVNVGINEAVNRYVAEQIRSPYDLPFFDNSAMDGYAVRWADTEGASAEQAVCLSVTKTVAAGDNPQWELKSGEAARIFTGAVVPSGADAVIAQEDVQVTEEGIYVKEPVLKGRHIRCQGEELKQGDIVIEQGALLTPASIGLVASLGIRELTVYEPPRIGIIVTGSEIIADSTELETGRIFDSNSFALSSALEELSLKPRLVKNCPDEKEALSETIEAALAETDFLIITGGVSVGDYDFVKEIAQANGVEEVFWKVKQKPGKPLYFGQKDGSKFLFGLPGNPASSLVCYYEYVRPAILQALGSSDPLLPRQFARLEHDFDKKSARVHFLRGKIRADATGNSVKILKHQGSHILQSFSRANCLIVIPSEQDHLKQGEMVETHLLPWGIFDLGGAAL